MKKIILTAFLGLSGLVATNAQLQQPVPQQVTDSVKIHFHVSKTYFDPNLSGNQEVLRSLAERLKDDGSDSLLTYKGVEFIGGASPEGSIKFNEYLSRARADQLFTELAKYRALPDSLRSFTFLGRDWGGLLQRMEGDPNIPDRAKALDLVRDIVAGKNVGGDPVAVLKRLCGGRPYAYLLRKHFPPLRAASMRISYIKVPRLLAIPYPLPEAKLVAEPAEPQPVAIAMEEPEVMEECSPFYMDIRTNMLYDAALLPTLGADFYIGKHFSVGGNWTYAWWSKNAKHRYWRAYGGDLNLQWFFGERAQEKPLQGHHIGVYGQILTYDFEFHGKGWMGGKPGGDLWDKMHWGVGLNYGYSLPVGRRLNIDFSLGFGYMTGTYYTYKPIDNCYVWQSTKTRHYFGPTKAEVSLVWLIGCGNYNKKKGGVD